MVVAISAMPMVATLQQEQQDGWMLTFKFHAAVNQASNCGPFTSRHLSAALAALHTSTALHLPRVGARSASS
jgi:hypothetical protein